LKQLFDVFISFIKNTFQHSPWVPAGRCHSIFAVLLPLEASLVFGQFAGSALLRRKVQSSGADHPESDIVVLVVRVVVVPVGHGAVRRIVVPTAAAFDAVRARSGFHAKVYYKMTDNEQGMRLR